MTPKPRKEETKASKGKGRSAKSVPATEKAKPAAAAETPAPAKPTGPMRNVTALVVPPFSLSMGLMELINENYQVVEMAQLDIAELEPVFKRRSSQPILVVLSSLEQITE